MILKRKEYPENPPAYSAENPPLTETAAEQKLQEVCQAIDIITTSLNNKDSSRFTSALEYNSWVPRAETKKSYLITERVFLEKWLGITTTDAEPSKHRDTSLTEILSEKDAVLLKQRLRNRKKPSKGFVDLKDYTEAEVLVILMNFVDQNIDPESLEPEDVKLLRGMNRYIDKLDLSE